MTEAGALRFARFAYPPNALGYCGPDAGATLLEYADAGATDRGLVELARGFEGAWPYLMLIAGAAGIADPLDPRVVDAYWLGGPLLERVGVGLLGPFLEETFRSGAGARWTGLAGLAATGAVPHHNLHVFGVYPWLGLLRLGREVGAMRVLDGCRIRHGRVVSVTGERAVVRQRALTWDGDRLAVGEPAERIAVAAENGRTFTRGLRTGDRVALHWDWICDRIGDEQARTLDAHTRRALDAANRAGRPVGAALD